MDLPDFILHRFTINIKRILKHFVTGCNNAIEHLLRRTLVRSYLQASKGF